MKKYLFIGLVALLIGAVAWVALSPYAYGWGPRGCEPRVRPQPKQEDEKDALPLPEAPDKTEWNETEGIELSEEALEDSELYEDFKDLEDLKSTKPIMIFFYWPAEDLESEDGAAKEQARRTRTMGEILDSESVRAASTFFHCFKVGVKGMDDNLKDKYRIRYAPKVVFFDVNGKKVWWLTNIKASPAGVSKKMCEIAAESKKLLEQAKK